MLQPMAIDPRLEFAGDALKGNKDLRASLKAVMWRQAGIERVSVAARLPNG